MGLEPHSVLNKLANPKFAASVDRAEIAAGAASLDIGVEMLVSFVIDALSSNAHELGLSGK